MNVKINNKPTFAIYIMTTHATKERNIYSFSNTVVSSWLGFMLLNLINIITASLLWVWYGASKGGGRNWKRTLIKSRHVLIPFLEVPGTTNLVSERQLMSNLIYTLKPVMCAIILSRQSCQDNRCRLDRSQLWRIVQMATVHASKYNIHSSGYDSQTSHVYLSAYEQKLSE